MEGFDFKQTTSFLNQKSAGLRLLVGHFIQPNVKSKILKLQIGFRKVNLEKLKSGFKISTTLLTNKKFNFTSLDINEIIKVLYGLHDLYSTEIEDNQVELATTGTIFKNLIVYQLIDFSKSGKTKNDGFLVKDKKVVFYFGKNGNFETIKIS